VSPLVTPVSRLATLAFVAAAMLSGCTAVQDTGALLYKDTATDSFDGRYPGFNQFLNRVSGECNRYPVGSGTISTLIASDSNMIDALSRLYEGKIQRAGFSAFLGGWYPGTDTNVLANCIFAQLPTKPAP
jgi:hypothetical protein